MTGTQNHEGLAGVAAAVDYLRTAGGPPDTGLDRRGQLRSSLTVIQAYEAELGRRLLEGLAARPRFRVWGIKDPARFRERVPTVSITLPGRPAGELAAHLAARDIYAWNGNMYALSLAERLGLEGQGGFLRLGLVHYNTPEEIDRLLAALDEL
jgi:selenocysteine lyase/cysteine desulfurase